MKKKTKAVVSFTTRQVSEMAKVSLRQLQWWDEGKVLVPRRVVGGLGGQGNGIRMYSEDQLFQARKLQLLRAAGISLATARKILQSNLQWKEVLRVHTPTIVGDVLVVPRQKAVWKLLTEGSKKDGSSKDGKS